MKFATITLLAGTASAQGLLNLLGGLPTNLLPANLLGSNAGVLCAVSCLNRVAPTAGCTPLDGKCICNAIDGLLSTATSCLNNFCGQGATLNIVIPTLKTNCQQFFAK